MKRDAVWLCEFEKGEASRVQIDDVSRGTLCLIAHTLSEGGRLPEPWERFAVTVDDLGDFAAFTVWADATCFFAAHPQHPIESRSPLAISSGYACCAEALQEEAWAHLERSYHRHVEACLANHNWDAAAPPDRPSVPWLGVITSPTAMHLSSEHLRFLRDLHICIAVALYEKLSSERNSKE